MTIIVTYQYKFYTIIVNFQRQYTSIYCLFASFRYKEGTNTRFKIVLLCKNRTLKSVFFRINIYWHKHFCVVVFRK